MIRKVLHWAVLETTASVGEASSRPGRAVSTSAASEAAAVLVACEAAAAGAMAAATAPRGYGEDEADGKRLLRAKKKADLEEKGRMDGDRKCPAQTL